MADRTGLGVTTLHYLTVQQATCMMNAHRPIHSKIMLTYMYLLTLANWLLYTQGNGFQGAINAMVALS